VASLRYQAVKFIGQSYWLVADGYDYIQVPFTELQAKQLAAQLNLAAQPNLETK